MLSKSTKRIKASINVLGVLCMIGVPVLFVSCSPKVATSFWKIGTPADSVRPGYTIIHAEGKTRHCYPITEWQADPAIDTYHQLHHHGVAMENEWVAYRIYFDKKQTIDPYIKRKPQLELGSSYWYPNDSLLAAHYGDDVLRVSGTVGVGTVKYWDGKKARHIEGVDSRSQRIVRQSRNSATIEVAVKGWRLNSILHDMAVQYTLEAGHHDMRCDVYMSDPVEGLCTGVQTIPAKGGDVQRGTRAMQMEHGVLLASWGTDWPVNDSAKYAKETVGLAVFIPREYAGDIKRDKSNLLCLLRTQFSAKSQQSMRHQAHFYLIVCGATKEDHPAARTEEEWYDYVQQWAQKLK